MSQKWIIQNNLINQNDLKKLKTACKLNSVNYKTIKVIPFLDKIPSFPKDEGYHIYYGSTTFITNVYKRRPRGIFFNDYFHMRAFNHNWKERMLNYDCISSSLENFCKRNENENSQWFIRPNADSKLFPGQVLSFAEIKEWNNKIQESTTLGFDEILFSKPKIIEKEWRLIIVNRKVITSCLYRENFNLKIDRNDNPSNLWKFAEDCCQIYSPENVFVIDIALIKNNYKIIECNCFNMSGFYDCDYDIIVKEVSQFMKNWVKSPPRYCSRIAKLRKVK